MKEKQTVYNLINYFKSLAVKLETTHKSAKPPINQPNYPRAIQTTHKPSKNQPNQSQTSHKPAKPPTSYPNYPQTTQTIHKSAAN